jgi:cyclopropane fatty-acyl-phospholipid synthase-like methyltransferase
MRDWPVTVDSLQKYDQDHFGGAAAVEKAIANMPISDGAKVLDIGSGFGGPARWIAAKVPNSFVTGIELQWDRHELALELTNKLKLSKQVRHLHGDAVEEVNRCGCHYSHIVSWLAILHIERKIELLTSLGSVLQFGGRLWIEDYCRVRSLSSDETLALREIISCPNLLTVEEYKGHLMQGGIVAMEEYTTNEWETLANARLANLDKQLDSNDTAYVRSYEKAKRFSEGVSKLFNDKAIIGVRITGVKT